MVSERNAQVEAEPVTGGFASVAPKNGLIDTEQLREQQRLLLHERRRLLRAMETMPPEAVRRLLHSKGARRSPTPAGDDAEDEYENDSLELLEMEWGLLADVNKALELAHKRTLGVCEAASQLIAESTLQSRHQGRTLGGSEQLLDDQKVPQCSRRYASPEQ